MEWVYERDKRILCIHECVTYDVRDQPLREVIVQDSMIEYPKLPLSATVLAQGCNEITLNLCESINFEWIKI